MRMELCHGTAFSDESQVTGKDEYIKSQWHYIRFRPRVCAEVDVWLKLHTGLGAVPASENFCVLDNCVTHLIGLKEV
jgi:hypothetical protein